MQSIIVRCLGPTDRRGTRFKATASGGESVTIPASYDVDRDRNALCAASKLARRLNWSGRWFGGSIKGGWVFVCEDRQFGFDVPKGGDL